MIEELRKGASSPKGNSAASPEDAKRKEKGCARVRE
jgi:hypothetical protein